MEATINERKEYSKDLIGAETNGLYSIVIEIQTDNNGFGSFSKGLSSKVPAHNYNVKGEIKQPDNGTWRIRAWRREDPGNPLVLDNAKPHEPQKFKFKVNHKTWFIDGDVQWSEHLSTKFVLSLDFSL
jgi:hypothetical protein